MKVLITGIASGIGKATKDYFLDNGHIVYGIDINTVEARDNLFSYKCDITNEQDLIKIKKEFESNNITFDAIINIAGIHKMASLIEEDFAKIKKLIDIKRLNTLDNNFLPPKYLASFFFQVFAYGD